MAALFPFRAFAIPMCCPYGLVAVAWLEKLRKAYSDLTFSVAAVDFHFATLVDFA